MCQLEYLSNGEVAPPIRYTTPEDLRRALSTLDGKRQKSAQGEVMLKLFVVEDLSREVIETLGYHLEIEPDFFRAHIFDHVWFNIRDPFWDPPSFQMDIRRRNWVQIRFCRARYFPSPESLREGQDAVNRFNVGRRLYDDENKVYWDRDPAKNITNATLALREWLTVHLKNLRAQSMRVVRRSTELFQKSPGNKTPNIEAQRHALNELPRTPGNDDWMKGTAKAMDEDRVDGRVGLMRTRVSFWKKNGKVGECDIGRQSIFLGTGRCLKWSSDHPPDSRCLVT